MTRGRRIWRRGVNIAAIVSVLAAGLLGAATATAPLGTARGVRAAQLSLDGGKTWLPVGARAVPLLEGTQIRSSSGHIRLDLADGSRVTVLPFSALHLTDTGRVLEMSLDYGRLAFQLPSPARVAIVTPPARLEPVGAKTAIGEVFLTGAGLIGVKMTSGQLQVQGLIPPRQAMLASLEPVFLPKKPDGAGFFFSSDSPTAIPGAAKAVFMASGASIGYLSGDRGFVIHPGFTADLTRPFSPKLVRLAVARVADRDRPADAQPLFDVNGQYVGYLAGPVFYASNETLAQAAQPSQPAQPEQISVSDGLLSQATQAQAIGGTTGTIGGAAAQISAGTWAVLGVVAGVEAGVGVTGATMSEGGGGAPPVATRVGP